VPSFPGSPDADPYDALLILSFGGPEAPEDVLPFLRNVTRGRDIPDERLREVGAHYDRFGGVSPINAQNRALVSAVEAELVRRELNLRVYWGNRNWAPYLAETLATMRGDGVRHAAVFVTAAYSSYSGCRQYREDLAAAAEETGTGVARLDKLRHYFNHPGFIEPGVDAVVDALAGLAEPIRAGAHLAFVTHSVPAAMAATSGLEGGTEGRTEGGAAGGLDRGAAAATGAATGGGAADGAGGSTSGGAYVRQHLETARLVAAGVAAQTGVEHPWELVFCSRSGPPTQAWLEPDVNDHLTALSAAGAPGVVVVPIGFVSDHMEVKFDLDTEAAETASRLGLPMARAATAGVDPRFVAMIIGLLLERAAVERGAAPPRPHLGSVPASHDVCPVGCCPNLRAPRPALGGVDAPNRDPTIAFGGTT